MSCGPTGVETYVSHSSLSVDERRRSERAFAEARDCVIVVHVDARARHRRRRPRSDDPARRATHRSRRSCSGSGERVDGLGHSETRCSSRPTSRRSCVPLDCCTCGGPDSWNRSCRRRPRGTSPPSSFSPSRCRKAALLGHPGATGGLARTSWTMATKCWTTSLRRSSLRRRTVAVHRSTCGEGVRQTALHGAALDVHRRPRNEGARGAP